jgi:Xaa-Pro aminopeptidase
MDYPGRVKRLQKQLGGNKLDSLLVTHLPNIRYLCGFSGSAGALLVSEKGAELFTDSRYTSQAQEEVKGAKVVIARKVLLLSVAEWLGKRSQGSRSKALTIGIEEEALSVASRRRFVDALPSRIRLRQTPSLVEKARMIKDAEEIGLIRAAVLAGAKLFDTALKTIRPGVAEMEVAAEMEYAARKGGASAMSFDTIIAAGERSALPHGRASEARIPSKGFVVCDFGVILAGYCSDMTRTVWVGRVSDGARQAYEAVREAQQAGLDAIRPGAGVDEVDQAARKSLKKSGLARYFTHSTGHGVGLEIHEAPKVAAGQQDVLAPGMVITIEPGIYIPGKWGIRIEDMAVVTETGCEVLTPTSKEFMAV